MSEIRIGLLGLDTSHAPAFAKRLNDAKDPEYVPGGRVVAGWKGGSADWEISRGRVEKFTAEVSEKYGVKVMDSPEAVAEAVDLIMITAVDGRAHRDLFSRVVKFKKPTFIDKPLAASSADAEAIFKMADEAGVAVMSCSTLRYSDALEKALATEDLGKVVGCEAWGPMELQAPLPGWFWYGIHTVEVMNVIMGHGCHRVHDLKTEGADVAEGVWPDGRIATLRGMRQGHHKFGAVIHREKGYQLVDLMTNERSWYSRMLEKVVGELAGGKMPVNPRDTLEIVRFMEAANESRESGKVVAL